MPPGREGISEEGAPHERELVERAQGGDSRAFGRLFRGYVDRVYSYIAFRTRDPALAEDLTQDVFLQALRGLGSFTWHGSFAPWLLRIARNVVIDHWRRAGRRPEQAASSLEAEGEDEGQGLISRHANPVTATAPDDVDLVVLRDQIEQAAQHLTELQQQVLALRFSAGLSIRETAEVMGKSEGAVKNLQHHAVRRLKRQLNI